MTVTDFFYPAVACIALVFLLLNAVAFRRYAFSWDDDPLNNLGGGMFWMSAAGAIRLLWWDILRAWSIALNPGLWEALNMLGVGINVMFNAAAVYGGFRKLRGFWLMIPLENRGDYPLLLAAFYPRRLSLWPLWRWPSDRRK
ncbi:hypothetical protein GGQ68_002524 [Sagittula marina]|uniref:Uncharacterized protein n=1 Tax=Sagittula marina TaxID=943940 RepID=A0A7W6DR41_9RHOB|nr:hypothetical protein [Sagittula marina]MBB3986186.1 hypothetical protein [Sagittula marina]